MQQFPLRCHQKENHQKPNRTSKMIWWNRQMHMLSIHHFVLLVSVFAMKEITWWIGQVLLPKKIIILQSYFIVASIIRFLTGSSSFTQLFPIWYQVIGIKKVHTTFLTGGSNLPNWTLTKCLLNTIDTCALRTVFVSAVINVCFTLDSSKACCNRCVCLINPDDKIMFNRVML